MPKKIDLTGQRFGRLVVIEKALSKKYKNGRIKGRWLCRCDCGNTKIVTTDGLKYNTTKSCGCLNNEKRKSRYNDLTGKKIGKLTVLKKEKERSHFGTINWLCQCDCGNKVVVMSGNLVTGNSTSCGCKTIEATRKNGQKYYKKAFEGLKEKHLKENTNLSLISKNKPQSNNKTSGIRGVHWDDTHEKWIAKLNFKGKTVLNKTFSVKQDAINARKEAEEKYFKPILDKYDKGANE